MSQASHESNDAELRTSDSQTEHVREPMSESRESDDREQNIGDVLAAVLEHTQPAQFSKPWQFLKPSDAFRVLRADAPTLLAMLRAKFSESLLLRSRVLVQSANTIMLNRMIDSPLLHVVRDSQGRPVDFDSDAGSLLRRGPPSFRFALERGPASAECRRVFVAGCEDAQVLSSLGLPITSIARLKNLLGAQVRQLLDVRKPSSAARYRLTLVGWHVATLESDIPKCVLASLSCFSAATELFNVDDRGLGVDCWMPTAAQVGRIQAAVRFEDRKLIQDTILETFAKSIQPALTAWQTLQDARQISVADATNELRQVVERSKIVPFAGETRVAKKRANLALERLTKHRFLKAADEAATPEESVLLLTLADQFERLRLQQSLFKAAGQVERGEHPTSLDAFEDDLQVRERELLLFLKLSQMLLRYQR